MLFLFLLTCKLVSHLLQQRKVQTFHQVSMLHVTSQELGLLDQLTTFLCCRFISERYITHKYKHTLITQDVKTSNSVGINVTYASAVGPTAL